MRRPHVASLLLSVTILMTGASSSFSQQCSISGRIEIEGRSGHEGILVWVDPLHSAVTDINGDFEIQYLDDGEYVVSAWAENCLSAIVNTVTVSGGDVTGVIGLLFPGDVHTDGRINLYDSGEMLMAYGSTPDSALWNPILDLDGNSFIDALDISLLIDRWKAGDEVQVPEWDMVVIEPGEGDIWWMGQHDVTIRWTTANLGGDVSIYFLHGSTTVDTIAESTPNDGEFNGYDVSSDLVSDGGYRILVRKDEIFYDHSSNFAIRQAIMVYMPDSTSAWWPGHEYAHIQWWNRAGLTSAVSLFLYKGDELLHMIVEGRPYDQEFYHWSVPTDLESGDDYTVLAKYDNSPEFFDFSDHFDIRPRFQVFEPSGITWYQGQEDVLVRWEHAELGGTVTIRLLYGDLHIDLIAEDTPNDGIYNEYDVLFDLTPGDRYKVEVYHDEKYNARSRDYFEVAEFVEPVAHSLYGVSMADSLTGVAVGYLGTILRTTNGGVTWSKQNMVTMHTLYDVDMVDDMTGTAVGRAGTIVRTTDGGASWMKQFCECGTLHAVCFTDVNTGTAVGDYGDVVSTTDGGVTWTRQAGVSDHDLLDVSFMDEFIGIAVGNGGTILRTDDGGITWTRLESGVDSQLRAVEIVDSDNCYVVGVSEYDEYGRNGILLETSDGGATWGNRIISYGDEPLDLVFTSENHGVIVGTNWFFSSGSTSIILWTDNGGGSWVEREGGTSIWLYSVSFSDQLNGTAAGCLDPGTTGIILRTTDGGVTWTTQLEQE